MAFLQQWCAQGIDQKTAAMLREIGEHQGRIGKSGLRILSELRDLQQITAEHAAAAACRLESPRSSVEQADYQRLLQWIGTTAPRREFDPDVVLRLHSGLSGSSDGAAGCSTDAVAAVERLCNEYLALEHETEALLLIGAFFREFAARALFSAGNLRTALLSVHWLLLRHGFTAGKFVSLERILEGRRTEFRAVLHPADPQAKTEGGLPASWPSVWLGLLLAASRELAARTAALSGRRGVKTDMVLSLLHLQKDPFTLREILQQVPECGIEMLRKVVKAEKAAGRIECLGRGPNAPWRTVRTRTRRRL